MKIELITGGAGFVGSNLARLVDRSVLLDWRRPDYLFEGSELVFDGSEFFHGDIRDMDDFEPLSDKDIDSIFHLAAIPGIKKCEEEPELAREVNIDGTENVLEFARENDVENVIFASSAGVYGEIEEHPIKEGHPIDPLNLYSETKVEGEKLCKKYSEDYGLDTTVMRMSNLYGPGFQVKPNLTVIPLFILKALQNQPLTVYGDGEQTRDFVHVKDVAQAYTRAFENEGSSFEIYNLGSGITASINELAKTVSKVMNELYQREVEITHTEMPEWRDEAKEKFDYSIQKIKKELNYKPEFSLEEGIREIFRNAF